MINLDFFFSSNFLWISAVFCLLFLVSVGYGSNKWSFLQNASEKTLGCLIFPIMLLLPILSTLYLLQPAYQSLRRDFEPSSWHTVAKALDFVIGYLILLALYFLTLVILIIAVGTVINLITSRIKTLRRLEIIEFLPGAMTVGIVGFYLTTLFDNCFLYSIDRVYQSILFGSSGQAIIPFVNLGIETGLRSLCDVTTYGGVADIANHPIAVTNAFAHVENVLTLAGLNENLSKLISFISPWLSPIADILGIYAFFRSSRFRKKNENN